MEYFSKRYRHLKILHKFHRLLFVFLFVLHFRNLFFYFTYPNLSKNFKHFCGVLFEGLEILSMILGISKISFTKRQICEIIFFFKILRFTICFFYFVIIFEIFFSISSIYTCQKVLEIFMFFILLIRDFIKDFLKIIEHCSKKYRHLKSKILHKFHCLIFVFFSHF